MADAVASSNAWGLAVSLATRRSVTANRKMWAMLNDLARQVHWPVDGVSQLLDAEDWKHVMSAGLKKHQRVAAGIEGGFVILGQHTSKFTVGEMNDLITLMTAFGAERGVIFSDPELASYEAAA
jgi:hypothetical protein